MKIYHIADLHFGKSIYGLSMLQDQRYWSEQFLELCKNNRPDAVLIAGDVYDRSAPSGDAVELLDYFLTGLAEMEIPVFLVAGNHDSGQRLAFAKTLLAKEYVHISGTVERELAHYTFEDPDGNGPVTVWMLPYTYPEQISVVLDNQDLHTYNDAIGELIKNQDINTAQRNIILSHQNVTANGEDAEMGGSETMVGTVGQIDYGTYNDFDYVALGHIHSAYPVGRKEVRFAGTPLCYHLKETRQKEKGVTEVILNAKGEEVQINMIPIKPLHRMRYFVDTKENIYRDIEAITEREEYIGIVLSDERVKPEIYNYLKQLIESKGSMLLELLSSYTKYSNDVSAIDVDTVKEKPLEDLFADLYTDRRGGKTPEDEVYDVLKYVSELVSHRDPHAPIDAKDVTRIVYKAKTTGGNE